MSRFVLALTVAGVVIITLGAAVAFAGPRLWPSSTLLAGERIGGVDVGGLTPEQARRRVTSLQHTLTRTTGRLRAGEQTVRFTGRALRLRVDVEGPLQAAIDRARDAGWVTRAVGAPQGVDAAAPDVTWDRAAVARQVRRLARHAGTAPRDGTATLTLHGPRYRAGRMGRAVHVKRTTAQLTDALERARSADVDVRAVMRDVRPKVLTSSDAWALMPSAIVVNRATFKLRVYRHRRMVREYGVAVGAIGYTTPPGLFAVQSKQVNPVWNVPNSPWAGELAGTTVAGGTAENPLKARWIGVNGSVGIHGTGAVGSIGTRASHGCVRMRPADVIDLFEKVDVGTPVLIV